jgi:hypothetical protein
MLVTLLGIITEVKPVQPLKADLPMLVTLFGIDIDIKPTQPRNASSCIDSIPIGIEYIPEKDEGIYTNI